MHLTGCCAPTREAPKPAVAVFVGGAPDTPNSLSGRLARTPTPPLTLRRSPGRCQMAVPRPCSRSFPIARVASQQPHELGLVQTCVKERLPEIGGTHLVRCPQEGRLPLGRSVGVEARSECAEQLVTLTFDLFCPVEAELPDYDLDERTYVLVVHYA